MRLHTDIAKPSWCFVVITKYFIPAAAAAAAQLLALNRVGLNVLLSPQYLLHQHAVMSKNNAG